jgi:hypothetical protein
MPTVPHQLKLLDVTDRRRLANKLYCQVQIYIRGYRLVGHSSRPVTVVSYSSGGYCSTPKVRDLGGCNI